MKLDFEQTLRTYNQTLENYSLKFEKAKADMKEVAANLAKSQREYDEFVQLMQDFSVRAPKAGMVTYKRGFDGKKVGLVHIDCDTYTSTLQVLEFLVSHNLLVDGTILVYDDWGAWKQACLTKENEYDIAEGRAHKEIAEKYNLNFEFVGTECIDPEYYYVTTFRYTE